MSPWRIKARDAITRALAAGLAAGEDKAALRKRIDGAYPFGERKYWPYKEWLDERQRAFFDLGLSTPDEIARRARRLERRMANGHQPKRREVALVEAAEREARESGLIR